MIEKTCYFFNVGTTFDKNNKDSLKGCWNCNPFCCKADLCNGLWCENYGIVFNKDYAKNYIKKYVEDGVENTYGYIQEVNITLSQSLWDEIYESLVKDYTFDNIKIAKENGFIPFDYYEIIENYSSYWEKPDMSFFKDKSKIKKNVIEVLKESELNQDTIKWINDNFYSKSDEIEI